MQTAAEISADGRYRYSLIRRWGDAPMVRWIMLNPSTATADVDDPTIRRCMGFARAWTYGGILVHNLFAYRATSPKAMIYAARNGVDVIGPRTPERLTEPLEPGTLTVCAWGANGALHDRGPAVLALLREHHVTPLCLGLTAAGHPLHPLYLPVNTDLRPVSEEDL